MIERARDEHGLSLKDLTVLASQNDPFRIDTPAGHRDGEWLAIQRDRLIRDGREVHLRGFHYMLVSDRPDKPNGEPYSNTDTDWLWLCEKAADAARWLGYIPFDKIIDRRNDKPQIRVRETPLPLRPYLTVDFDIEIPDVDDLVPKLWLGGFYGEQPYRIVLAGEKSSLGSVLGPVAEGFDADLFLPTGCMSDTMIHAMAKAGAEDGRPMVVMYFADFDPGGHSMPVEVARKLQAFRALLFPDLDVRVYRVALTVDQVREHELPSTPLKSTETRAGKWRAAMGVEQTEIDALAALRPELLDRIARDAIEPFYDFGLDGRVRATRQAWLDEAVPIVNAGLDSDRRRQIYADAEGMLDEIRGKLDDLKDELRIDVRDFELPEIPDVPDPQVNGEYGLPLLDSSASYVDQTQALIRDRGYGGTA